ncbi:c-type cytochrome [Ignatzschineria sp. LJL83]
MKNIKHQKKLIAIMFFLFLNLSCFGFSEIIPIERQQELQHLLTQDCGSCHGLKMKGGLGPALTFERLKEKPKEGLEATIFYGRPGTPMPAWNAFISRDEAAWLVQQLLEEMPL